MSLQAALTIILVSAGAKVQSKLKEALGFSSLILPQASRLIQKNTTI